MSALLTPSVETPCAAWMGTSNGRALPSSSKLPLACRTQGVQTGVGTGPRVWTSNDARKDALEFTSTPRHTHWIMTLAVLPSWYLRKESGSLAQAAAAVLLGMQQRQGCCAAANAAASRQPCCYARLMCCYECNLKTTEVLLRMQPQDHRAAANTVTMVASRPPCDELVQTAARETHATACRVIH